MFYRARMNILSRAIEKLGGVTKLARVCGVSYQAVRRWEKHKRLPRTELTGETDYANRIAKATGNKTHYQKLITFTRTGWKRAA